MIKFVVLLLLITARCMCAYPQGKYEIRASWITTIGGLDWPTTKASSQHSERKQKEELCRQLDLLQEANFNTVILQVRLRGDVIYPSVFEPYAECLTGHAGKSPGYDPLKFAIDECHKRGLELHAWMVSIPVGKNSLVKKRPELCKKFDGAWYLDPGNPGTADYLTRMVKEVVSNYEVDGIHLDYIRYPENCKDFPDKDTYRKYGHGLSLAQWRRNNITQIVRKIYHEVKALKPWVKVSSSPVGKYNDTSRYSSRGWNAYDAVYQDAQAWMREGIQDLVFPMMYFKKNQFYPFALDWQENKHDRWVVPGLGIYFLEDKSSGWSVEEVLRQIHFVRKNNLDGQAFFRNKFITNNSKKLTESISTRFYRKKAVVPPMRWHDSIPPMPPQNGEIFYSADSIKIRWSISENGKEPGLAYRIYASDTYPVDTELSENLICVKTASNAFGHNTINGSKRYWAVTATDVYGNESTPLEINRPKTDDAMIYVNRLPEMNEGSIAIISDVTGMELLRAETLDKKTMEKLGKGTYSITITHPKENNKALILILTDI